MRLLKGHREAVLSVAYSPDGKILASGGLDRTVHLWDVLTGKLTTVLRPHKGGVWAVAFAPDGQTLAAGGGGKALKLWDLSRVKAKANLIGHTAVVKCVGFLPGQDGTRLISGGGDRSLSAHLPGQALLWDLENPHDPQSLWTAENGVLSLAFSPDGHRVALGTGNHEMVMWNLAQRQPDFLQHQPANVRGLAFHPEGNLLASIATRNIRLWNAQDGTRVKILKGHEDVIQGLEFSLDGRLLLSGGRDGTACLWDTISWEARAFDWGVGKIYAVAFSPDGMTAAAAGQEGLVALWDLDAI